MSKSLFISAVVAGQHSVAIKLLDAAILHAADSQQAQQALCGLYINRGVCNAKLQLYRKALKDYETALSLEPSSVEALYHKGVVLQALQRSQEAEECWRSALAGATLNTDLSLIQSVQDALFNPAMVVAHIDPCSYLWAQCTRPWLLALLALLVITLAYHSTQHTLQVVAIAGAPHGPATCSGHVGSATPPVSIPSLLATPAASPAHAPSPADASTSNMQHQQLPLKQTVTPPTTDTCISTRRGEGSDQHDKKRQDAAGTTGMSASSSSSSSAGQPARQKQEQGATPATPSATASAEGANNSSRSRTAGGAVPGNDEDGVDVASAAQYQATLSKGLQNGLLSTGVQPHRSSTTTRGGSESGSKQRQDAGSLAASAGGASGGVAGAPHNVVLEGSQLSVALAIQTAVAQINSGQVQEAEALLDGVLASNPKELGALVARGTARALRRDLRGAIQDFSGAIDIEPRYADTWKRRGQARSALGELEPALTDLAKAIDLLPLWGQDTSASQAECHVEKGLVYQKQRDYQRATQALKQAVKLDPRNHQAWNLLGLSSTSQGDLRDGVRAYERAVELQPDFKEAWFNMAQARKEAGMIAEAEAALARLQALEGLGKTNVAALKVQSQMQQQAGQHWAAVSLVNTALDAAKDEMVVLDLRFMRAICYHALGLVREAVSDYEACLSGPSGNSSSRGPGAINIQDDTRNQQYLAFYQREMALYLYHSLDRRADSFCPDAELGALFKEMWCKKSPPTPELLSSYSPQPPVPRTPPALPPAPGPQAQRSVQQLIEVADTLGVLLQNQHQGFMSNARQQRAAGFAALELAQALRALLAARKEGSTLWVNNAAASGPTAASSSSSSAVAAQGPAGAAAGSGASNAAAGRHAFGWRDAMDIVVKWRQLAEPNDQVLWVDRLTRREFEQGFGSHTPIFSGQTKCVRYYMNFERALGLHKQVLLKEGHAFDAQNRHVPCGGQHQQDSIRSACTAADMYSALQADSWVVIPIASMARPGHTLEGTRLTLVKVPNQPNAYEFSIRTPVTPPRWHDFDAELTAAWSNVVDALAQEPLDYPRAARSILVYAYYWYNFMPLARGTAACGYTTILSLMWAAGMPVTARIPKDVQVDWEAILAQHPDQFIDSIKGWLLPQSAQQQQQQPGGRSTAATQATKPHLPDVAQLPTVSNHLGTIRQRLQALNPAGVPRI